MKDPYIHVEKTVLPGFGNAEMRDFLTKALTDLGIFVSTDLPKTVGTGCGRRRKWSQVSKVPEKVTCLPCREYAQKQYTESADSAEALLSYGDDVIGEALTSANTTRFELEMQATIDRKMAERYK